MVSTGILSSFFIMDWFSQPGSMFFDSYMKECWKQANIAYEKVQVVEGGNVNRLNQQPRKVANIKISTTSPKIALEFDRINFYEAFIW
jgi:hypothetical protein